MFQPGSTLTVDNAKTVLYAGLQAIAAGQTEINLSALRVVDSSAVATLLAWRRRAVASSIPTVFVGAPDNLRNLIVLYDVGPLIDPNTDTNAGSAA